MLSTFQKISGAISSLTSSIQPKQPKQPKHLQRPPIEDASQPNDQPFFPAAAYMRRSRSGTSFPAGVTRPMGAKARKFLLETAHLEEEDDPIETSSPESKTGAGVRRIKPRSTHPVGRRHRSSPEPTRSKRLESRPGITHGHLIKDLGPGAEETSLIPGVAPIRSDAVTITIPGSTSLERSSFCTMRHAPYKPVNTLEMPQQKPTQRPWNIANRYAAPSSNASDSTRDGASEPPSKRARLGAPSTPYVKDEAGGAVSPDFRPSRGRNHTMLRANRSASRPAKPTLSANGSGFPPIDVAEFLVVERIVQPDPNKSIHGVETSPYFEAKAANSQRKRSEDSDHESFTRGSKRARHQQEAQDISTPPLPLDPPSGESQHRHKEKDTPTPIRDIFKSPTCPSVDASAAQEKDDAYARTMAGTHIRRLDEEVAGAATEVSNSNVIEVVAQSIAGKKSKSQPENIKTKSGHFPLRFLQYGILPRDASYVAVISESLLQIYDQDSRLSDEPLWPPLPLSKIFKTYHGSEDCLMVILEMSQCRGQPNTKMHIQFFSSEDREIFLSLIAEAMGRTLKVPKDDDYMSKCFDRIMETTRGTRHLSPTDMPSQPISDQRRQSDPTSPPRVANRQIFGTHHTGKPTKLTDRLQSSSADSKTAGADSRIPTIITGADRATRSTTSREIRPAARPRLTSQPSQPSMITRLRSVGGKSSVTGSPFVAEMLAHEAEELPPKKHSELHGLGNPWKNPLVFPKSAKRRMTVEHGDLFRLDEEDFLNDNLVGFFLRYLEHELEQTKPGMADRVHFYNSYFFERLMQTAKGQKGINYDSVQKWTRNVDIFRHDFIVVPVNEKFHWYVVIICNLPKLDPSAKGAQEQDGAEESSPAGRVLAPVDVDVKSQKEIHRGENADRPTEKTAESLSHLSLSDHDGHLAELAPAATALTSWLSRRRGATPRKSGPGRRKNARHSLARYDVSSPMIITLDSLGSSRSSTCSALRQYVVEEARDKKGWEIDGSLIRGMTAKGVPTQSNYSDCGLYLCAYMEKFILDPAAFVGQILQRKMDPERDMPMMASEELRRRMREMIVELHSLQEGEGSRFPLREVGGILLAPPRAHSPDQNRALQQDDSEDELQQDQTQLRVANKHSSPLGHRPDTINPPGGASTKSSRDDDDDDDGDLSHSDAVNSIADILAKINAEPVDALARAGLGTRETAITIDDDDEGSPNEARPVMAARNEKKLGGIIEDDRPPHEAVQVMAARNKKKPAVMAEDDDDDDPLAHRPDRHVSPRRSRKATRLNEGSADVSPAERAPPSTDQQHAPPDQQRRRSRSKGSSDTVNTDFLTGARNRSYRRKSDRLGNGVEGSAKQVRRQQAVVVVIPDSQEDGNRADATGGRGG